MQVIPVINCLDENCVKERLEAIRAFEASWIKFDISDGKFNPVTTWNNPEILASDFGFSASDGSAFGGKASDFNLEVHLMVKKPEGDLLRWLRVGAKRPIVHVESEFNIDEVLRLCSLHGAELMMAVNPDTPISDLMPYLDGRKASVKYVQLLAVTPGESGQNLQKHIPAKIKALKQIAPDVTIEIDGGINKETAKIVAEAGADIIVASSYIFGNDDPKKAYEELKSI